MPAAQMHRSVIGATPDQVPDAVAGSAIAARIYVDDEVADHVMHGRARCGWIGVQPRLEHVLDRIRAGRPPSIGNNRRV